MTGKICGSLHSYIDMFGIVVQTRLESGGNLLRGYVRKGLCCRVAIGQRGTGQFINMKLHSTGSLLGIPDARELHRLGFCQREKGPFLD